MKKTILLTIFFVLILASFSYAVFVIDDVAIAVVGTAASYCSTNNCVQQLSSAYGYLAGITFQLSPQTINLQNCSSQNLSLIVHTPLSLGNTYNIYVNGQLIGQAKGIMADNTFQIPITNNYAGFNNTEVVSIVAVAADSSGKGNTNTFNVQITHVFGQQEQVTKQALDTASVNLQAVQAKIQSYQQTVPMIRAVSIINNSQTQLKAAQQSFTNCNFTTTNSSISTTNSNIQLAENQADEDYRDGTDALNAIDQANSDIQDSQAKINAYQSQGADMSQTSIKQAEATQNQQAAQNAFSAGDFKNAKINAQSADSKTKEAVQLAEISFQNYKQNLLSQKGNNENASIPLTGAIILTSGTIMLVVTVLVIVIVTIAVVIYIRKNYRLVSKEEKTKKEKK